MGTQFDGSTVVIIAPFERAALEGGNIPSGLSAGDTWIHADAEGNIKLPGAQVLVPDDFDVTPDIEAIAARYVRGNTPQETMDNRNAAISAAFNKMDIPLKGLQGDTGTASLAWADSRSEDQDKGFKKLADRMFPNQEIEVGALHQESIDSRWSIFVSTQHNRMANYATGTRLIQDNNGVDHEAVPTMLKDIKKAEEFLKDRMANNADPKAIEFYIKQFYAVADRFEREVLPIHKSEVPQRIGMMMVSDAEGLHTAIHSAEEFIAKAQAGEVHDGHLVRQVDERRWTEYEGSYEARLINSMNYQRPRLEMNASPYTHSRMYNVRGNSFHNLSIYSGADNTEKAVRDVEALNKPILALMKSATGECYVPEFIYAAGNGRLTGWEAGDKGARSVFEGFTPSFRLSPTSQELFDLTQDRLRKFGHKGTISLDPRLIKVAVVSGSTPGRRDYALLKSQNGTMLAAPTTQHITSAPPAESRQQPAVRAKKPRFSP